MPLLTEEQLSFVGREGEPHPAAYPVNEIMARFWCEMVEDPNPIYFDEGYARSTWLTGRIAPPAMLLIWRMAPVWPARKEENPISRLRLEEAGCTATIAVNATQEYHQPLRYGDTLNVTGQIAALSEEKTTRLGSGHFVTTLDTFRNQHGQVVGTHSFTLFIYAPGAIEEPGANQTASPGSREQGPPPPAGERTGSGAASDALPPVSIDLTLRRAIQAVAGTRDYYPVHHDEAFARANGAKGIFFNTMFLQAFAARAAGEWFGNDALLRRMEIAMRGSNYVGKTLTATGVLLGTRTSEGRRLADVDCAMGTEDGITTGVKLTVELPPEA